MITILNESKIQHRIQSHLDAPSSLSPAEVLHLQIVSSLFDGGRQTPIVAAVKPLARYSILPGRVFGKGSKEKGKVKVLRLVADDVVVQDLDSGKVSVIRIDLLLEEWSRLGFKEISLLTEILDTVKKVIGPALGVFLTAALISWLTDKLS